MKLSNGLLRILGLGCCLGCGVSVISGQGWLPGAYLMLDESLIAEQAEVQREVQHPSRLAEPIVTGYEDGCFQPWVTVVRDPQTRRFRMWYNTPGNPPESSMRQLAYLESEDGMHWLRPHRVLSAPAIQTGASVIDEGPDAADLARRFKLGWWNDGGLQVAFSADGLSWKSLAPGPVLRLNHDITALARDPIRQRYLALGSVYSETRGVEQRTPHQSVSADLIHWQSPWPIIFPDTSAEIEKGATQFYGLGGVIARGNLLIGMVKVLRDDLNCEPGMKAAELHDTQRRFAGLGYTVLAWSHDGEHWARDAEPFLDRNPKPGTWDRAMTWGDCQIIVGDFVYLYYGGYRWGHKAERYTERQIGFAQLPRDRYVAMAAGEHTGLLRTRLDVLHAGGLSVNACVAVTGGELRLRALDGTGKPYPGFDWQDCGPILGDRVAHSVAWKAKLEQIAGQRVAFEFSLRRARLYAFELTP